METKLNHDIIFVLYIHCKEKKGKQMGWRRAHTF
jgi:hypothetical protein